MSGSSDTEYAHASDIKRLMDRRRYDRAAAAAGRAWAMVGGTRLAVLHAEALVASGQVTQAVDALSRVLDSGADQRAARDLALLLWHRSGEEARARDICLLGLADSDSTVPAGPGESGPTPDELRVARSELATLYLRLSPRTGLWTALDDVLRTPGLAAADRLLVTGFAHGLAGDHATALRLIHGGLARDPYHPVGLYDLACTLARQGGVAAASAVLLEAVRNGESRLAARFTHDPDLVGLAAHVDTVRATMARGGGADWHAVHLFQVGPLYDPHTARLRLRPGTQENAMAEFRWFDENVALLLSYGPGRNVFELHMHSDDLYFRGWDLHCALRRIAPLVEDTRWFQWDGNQNMGAFMDEFAVVDGVLHLTRTLLPRGSARDRLEVLRERVSRTPDDVPLAEAVAREATGGWLA